MPTYSRNRIDNYRIAENKKKYFAKSFLCSDLKSFQAVLGNSTLVKKQNRLISKTGFLISRVLTVFIISFFFTIYISQSHLKFYFPFPPSGIPVPRKPIPIPQLKKSQITVPILPFPHPLDKAIGLCYRIET